MAGAIPRLVMLRVGVYHTDKSTDLAIPKARIEEESQRVILEEVLAAVKNLRRRLIEEKGGLIEHLLQNKHEPQACDKKVFTEV